MTETSQGSGIETPKNTHGLNLEVPPKDKKILDGSKPGALKQDAMSLKEWKINDLALKLREDAQSLSLELEVPLGWTVSRKSPTHHSGLWEALKEIAKWIPEGGKNRLSNDEWKNVSRQNIQERLTQALNKKDIPSVIAIIPSLRDYEDMARWGWMDEWVFVAEMIAQIAKSDIKETVLVIMGWSLKEIKQVRTTAQRLDQEMKSKPAGSQTRLQDLNRDDVLFIQNSSLTGLFVAHNPILDQDFFSEKPGTPPGRLPWLQSMYEEMISLMEKTQ